MIVEYDARTIWICIGSIEESAKVQEFLLTLEASCYGDIPVKIFSAKEAAISDLPHLYDLNESALEILRKKFGEEEIKYMKRKYKRDTYELEPTPLERVAIALEKIGESLDAIAHISRGRSKEGKYGIQKGETTK